MNPRHFTTTLSALVFAAFAATAVAQQGAELGVTPIDEGATLGGTIISGTGVTPPEGDLVYHSPNMSGYFYRPYPGYLEFDDIHLEPGPNGDLVKYSFSVFGSTVTGADAGSPYNVHSALYTDDLGDPSVGWPDQPIPGTECDFVNIPAGSMFTLECVAPTGISIPDGLWMFLEFSTDNSGWISADFDDCPTTGPPGYSEDFWLDCQEYDGGLECIFFFFGPGCPASPQSSYGMAQIVNEGAPWACCDLSTYACANVRETECIDIGGVFTEGTLCNNLPTPCSQAGACCDTATGVCTDGFEINCGGYLQVFFPGALCIDIECEVPPNVPTLTQWGMFVLAILFASGLTIAFGRRRTASA